MRFGRIMFTHNALLPAIRLVAHSVSDHEVIVHAGLAIPQLPDNPVVRYEADAIDPVSRLGWCVIVTGTGETVTDTDESARYLGQYQPWFPGAQHRIIRIRPSAVTGIEVTDEQ
ncbi:hypothetical protein AWN90_04535 [Nocardia terpenica]|uniref:Pyridoxamine 5'-phosphate oxidase family protein n=1 Tax=Nocardia terpenica TaxID=455432 RepID=A0A164IZ69_9NOCA|nr:hypothetical protein AWN90_04535 [Nocardia terpenica]